MCLLLSGCLRLMRKKRTMTMTKIPSQNAVRKMSGRTPGSPRHPSSRHPRPSEFQPSRIFSESGFTPNFLGTKGVWSFWHESHGHLKRLAQLKDAQSQVCNIPAQLGGVLFLRCLFFFSKENSTTLRARLRAKRRAS